MAEVEKLVGSESPLEVGQKINEIIEKGVGGKGAGLQLFDTILKDHILTYEESKGLALQGTYVYKDAVAGSRYGYPDFYNKVVEEYNQATVTETVNGVEVKVHTNGHKFYDIANKSAIDSSFNSLGTAWFYGVDTENERVFLPRNNYFEQATGDTTEVGKSVEAGLPNITGSFASAGPAGRAKGAFYDSTGTTRHDSGNDATYTAVDVSLDASRSKLIYGNSDTVQPSAVKKLLYICVGNTESQSTITDVIDVTTTENDTTPLFTGMYFDFTPNNVSWLKGGEQVNSGGIYTTCYNELVNILNGETKYGELRVIDTADMVSGVDYSEYWKVNQTAMTFTTPTKISSRTYEDIAPVVGNGMTLGLTNGTTDGALVSQTEHIQVYLGMMKPVASAYGQPVNNTASTRETSVGQWGVTTDETKSGIEAHLVENTTAQLYFKVANAVQNLELLDVGEVLEAVNNVILNNSSLITSYCMPDYSAGVSFASGQSFAQNGWLFIHCPQFVTATSTVKLNNILVYEKNDKDYHAGYHMVSNTSWIPYASNSVITTSGSFTSLIFYPAKGAN